MTEDELMSQTIELKLTVYQPGTIAGPGQEVGFEYDLTIEVPDLTTTVKGNPATLMTLSREMSASSNKFSAECETIDVTGTLTLPNPGAPVISPFRGGLFMFVHPMMAFPLTIMGQSTKETLKFNLSLAFPDIPIRFYCGAIMFGEWPGPLSNVTASFLSPRKEPF
jgi:hypothetical protein